MAGSRLEKIGTIYTRTTGLIQSGALTWEDRPLWYDVYKAFPPTEEPRFDRPAPNTKLRKIFYEEDKIRALFHQNHKYFNTNLFSKHKSATQKFIDTYKEITAQAAGSLSDEEVFEQALEIFRKRADVPASETESGENISLSQEFKEATNREQAAPVNVNLKDIFKD